MQFLNWSHGMPGSTEFKVRMLLNETLMLTGVTPSPFELEYLQNSAIDPVLAQVISGLILRARLRPQKKEGPNDFE